MPEQWQIIPRNVVIDTCDKKILGDSSLKEAKSHTESGFITHKCFER